MKNNKKQKTAHRVRQEGDYIYVKPIYVILIYYYIVVVVVVDLP